MENETTDQSKIDEPPAKPVKSEIELPLVAFLLSTPVLLLFVGVFSWNVPSYLGLLLLLSPIAGLAAGIVALCRGKKRNGIAGMILAIGAIAMPAAIVIFVIGLFVGDAIGLISLM